MARSKDGKVKARRDQAYTGANFKHSSLEESYPRASLLRRRVNQYFEMCDMEGKHYSLPSLGLFLGLRTHVLKNYTPEDEQYEEHRLVLDYAIQRIEAYITDKLFETKGSTKGTEFLLQNTLGYANKSDVNSNQTLEVTEKQKIKQLSDEEVVGRLDRIAPKIIELTKKTAHN